MAGECETKQTHNDLWTQKTHMLTVVAHTPKLTCFGILFNNCLYVAV